MLVVREDYVIVTGQVVSAAYDADIPNRPPSYSWTILIEPDAADANRLVASTGATNVLGWLPCTVWPAAPYRYDPLRSGLLGSVIGQRIRISGTWCDVKDSSGQVLGTTISPIAWIAIDRRLSPIVEEHGFTQVIRDYDVFAFSDDRDLDAGETFPHHREDRHFEFAVAFPPRPQSNVPPVFSECDDRSVDEANVYDYKQKALPKRYPLRSVAQVTYTVNSGGGGDELQIAVDTGTPGNQQGLLYAKLALTYDEPFANMCLADVCLTDPAKACQFTGETRRTWGWPRMRSARVGDLLAGPAGGEGVLGRLLGALHPTQRFDHVVMFVEDDGQTVRHCTDSDARLGQKVYINGSVKIDTPFGSVDEKVPLAGIRSDVVQYGWPGSISQSLGEVTVTGRNRLNTNFGHATQYAAILAAEAARPFALWQLAPEEREKRTAFHDPEATETARSEKNADKLLHFGLPRLQKDPAFRADVGTLWPKLIKPHPYLDAQARATLAVVAEQARSIAAHYRFYAYSKSEIARDPAFVAPPGGDPTWPMAGSDWAAGTIAAMCSSFVWVACQAANDVLRGNGQPTIELEGEGEATDDRLPTDIDGLYRYQKQERLDAGHALYDYMYQRVTDEVNGALGNPSFPVSALVAALNIGGTVDDIKNYFATVVANQVCNTFAADLSDDFSGTWQRSDVGSAVSPDDLFVNWDVQAKPNDPNPPTPGQGRVNIYGFSQPVAIPDPGWVDEPIYRVDAVVGHGEVRGSVIRREPGQAAPERVVGATVRLGCLVTTTNPEGFSFAPVKAGRYYLQASMFVIDPDTNVGLEWTSKVQDIKIHDGDVLTGIELDLLPPPGTARTLYVHHHTDIVDRRVIGKDDWGHFNLDDKVALAFDPRDDPAAPPEQRNTKLDGHYDIASPEVGSGVHVRVTVDGRLHSVAGAGGSKHYDGNVEFDLHLTFYDADEGEIDATIDDTGILIAPGDPPYEKNYNLVSNDIVPERASGKIVIHNVPAALAGTN
jgi:hypothetical protein